MSREYVLVPKHKYEKMIESFQQSQDSSINPPIQSEERDNNEQTGEGTTVGKSQSSFSGENANKATAYCLVATLKRKLHKNHHHNYLLKDLYQKWIFSLKVQIKRKRKKVAKVLNHQP